MSDKTQTIFDRFVFGKVTEIAGGKFYFELNMPITVENATTPFTLVNGLSEGCVGSTKETGKGARIMVWDFSYPLNPDTKRPRYEFPLARGWAQVDGKFPPYLVYAKLLACAMRAGENTGDVLAAITNLVAGPLMQGTFSSLRNQRPFWNVEPGVETMFYLGKLTDWFDDQTGNVAFDTPFESHDGRIRGSDLRIREQGYLAYDADRRFLPEVGSTIFAFSPVSDIGKLRMEYWCPILFSEEIRLSLARIVASLLWVGPDRASELLVNVATICAKALLTEKRVFAVKKGSARGNGSGPKDALTASQPVETPATEIATEAPVAEIFDHTEGFPVNDIALALQPAAAAPTDEPEEVVWKLPAEFLHDKPLPEEFIPTAEKAFAQARAGGKSEDEAVDAALTALETAGVKKWDTKKKAWQISAKARKAVAETEKVEA